MYTSRRVHGIRRRLFESGAMPHLEGLYHSALLLTDSTDEAERLVRRVFIDAYCVPDMPGDIVDYRLRLFKIMSYVYVNEYSKTPERRTADFDNRQRLTIEEINRIRGRARLMKSPGSRTSPVLDPDIRRAMGQLAAKDRLVATLFFVEGFSYTEISDLVEAGVDSVKRRLVRGRKVFERLLFGPAVCVPSGMEENSN